MLQQQQQQQQKQQQQVAATPGSRAVVAMHRSLSEWLTLQKPKGSSGSMYIYAQGNAWFIFMETKKPALLWVAFIYIYKLLSKLCMRFEWIYRNYAYFEIIRNKFKKTTYIFSLVVVLM